MRQGLLWGILGLSCLAVAARGSEPGRGLQEMAADAELTDVCFVDADRGWAVGDRGVIWHTQDGGRQWQLQTSSTSSRLESVQFLDPQRGWAVGGGVHPYTHQSSCVVLRTQDGGTTWAPLGRLTLPALKRVRFLDAQRGWAVGNPSALYPVGVFRTEDGGRSWTTLPSSVSGRWTTGDFFDHQQGVVAGHDGQLAVVSAPRVEPSAGFDPGPRPLRAIRWVDRQRGWLVGDGGLVLRSGDGGRSWQAPSGALPDGVAALFDFHTVSAVGNHVWIAGSPGTCVLYSADDGHQWQLLRTGQTLPLRAVTFLDDQRGWSVGALGVVLGTRDGGRTWMRQRGGGTRLALLGLFSEPERIPMELFAQQSGHEGYLGYVEVLNRRDVETPLSSDTPREDQSRAALSAVGGCGADHAWQFPLRQAGLKLKSADVIATWDRITDGRGLPLLEERVVRKIRQWRPEVIITEPASPRGDQPLAHVINQVVLSAVHKAADGTAYPDHSTVGGLTSWRVKKVFSLASDEEGSTITLTTAQLATRLGRSVGEVAADGYALVSPRSERIPVTVGYRLLLDELPQSAGKRDVFSGIHLQPGGEARREFVLPPATDIDSLARAAQKLRNMEQLLDRTAGDSSAAAGWLGQVQDLTKSLNTSSAGRVLFQLGDRYRAAGQLEMAAQAWEHLVERYPDHPLCEPALLWLVQYYASGEIAWQLRRQTWASTQNVQTRVTETETTLATGVQPANFEQTTVAGVRTGSETHGTRSTAAPGLGSKDRAERAVAFANQAQRGRPTLFAEPQLQFPMSVAYRYTAAPREAERFYHRLSALAQADAWSLCAQAELWLVHGRGPAPKTAYACQYVPSRPLLDGRLDDECWRLATRLTLSSSLDDDQAWPATVMVSCDAQFLFLAATCRKPTGAEYPNTPGPRPRDADLSQRDRVEFLIDVDRDYATHYRLTIDHRGWPSEACAGNVHWNPTWYVAAAADDQHWTVEAAIAWEELVPHPPTPRDVWALGVHRIVPGVGVQSATRPARIEPGPDSFALMIFQGAPGITGAPAIE